MKLICLICVIRAGKSPPSRGAWIEIKQISGFVITLAAVAPLAGGVD